MKHAQRVARVDTPPVIGPVGIEVGHLVWFASREHGRTTEHLARVIEIKSASGLKVQITDQGETRTYDNVQPWGADSVTGWWKAQA